MFDAVVEVRGDLFKISKAGGFMEMQLLNATSGHAGWILADTGDGTLEFITPPASNLDGVLAAGGALTADRASDFATHKWTISNGKIVFAAPTTTYPSLNLPAGTAVTSPASGDLYHTTGHLYFRDGSTTYDLLNTVPPTPSWDATLAVGNTTSRTYQSIAGVASFYYSKVTPQDYNPGTHRDQFYTWVDGNFANPSSGRIDNVGSFWAYNISPGGGVITTGEAGFYFGTETFYEQDGTTLMEFHLPVMADNSGNLHRLWSTYVHRPTGYAYLQSQVGSLSFRHHWDNSGSTDWFSVGSGDNEIAGSGTTGTYGDVTMKLDASFGGTGKYARIQVVDGDGGSIIVQSNAGNGYVIAATDLYLQPTRYIDAGMNWNFFLSDYFSNQTVTFNLPDNTINHGLHILSLDGSNLLWLSKGLNVWWQPANFQQGAMFGSRVTIGTGVVPTSGAFLQIGAGFTTVPQINIAVGVGPTSPADGDVWLESNTNTGFKMRINGVTKTISLV